MAFTQGFENDVFISYSHRDNLAPRWVDHFHEALHAALKRKLGDDHVVVWRDPELGPKSLFNQEIKRMIDSSAVFLVLLSRNYLKSEYCKKEVDWFYSEETGLGLSIGDQSRIFIVLLNNIPLIGMMECWNIGMMGWGPSGIFYTPSAKSTQQLFKFEKEV